MKKSIPSIVYCPRNLTYFNNVRTNVKAFFFP
ncbi:hypothetical protein EDP2_187 [Enterobacter cloacae S611]|uniref:Uncharacterized protein n=1 Tax=Enterobacter cloacae S611 TaxID=1399146 RepID=A0ABN0Q4C5_ENTCL|nr:hypothetical protein EDP2_187 [Enterobacter cloacae S611]